MSDQKYQDGRKELPMRGMDVLVWCSLKRHAEGECCWRRATFENTILGKYPSSGVFPEDLHWELVYEPDCPVIAEFPYWIGCDALVSLCKVEELLDQTFGDRWREYMFGDVKRDGLDMIPLAAGGGWERVEKGDYSYFVPKKESA